MSNGDVQTRFVIIDASVGLKWLLLDEDWVEQAVALRNDALLGQFSMVAPTLCIHEVTNALVVATRRGRVTLEQGVKAINDFEATPLNFLNVVTQEVYEQCLHYNIAAYDAAYLVLAESLNAPLWTGDRRFYEAVRSQADFVYWIGDYPSAANP